MTLTIGIPGLYATKTRAPIAATLIVAAVIVLLSSRRRLLGLGAIAVASLTLLALWPQIKSSHIYRTRISQTQNVDIRLVLQRVSIKLAEARPILGWGYGSFDKVKFKPSVYSASIPVSEALEYTSHDTYLTTLVEMGLVGLALLVFPGVIILVRAARRARIPSPDRWALVAGISSVLVIGLVAATLDFRFISIMPVLAWMFLGVLRRQTALTAART